MNQNQMIEIEGEVEAFLASYLNPIRVYDAFCEKCGKVLSRDEFLSIFNDKEQPAQLPVSERLAIEQRFRNVSFKEMVGYNLNGVKYPDQEKDEILFELISGISSIMDPSPGNLHRIEVMRQRWSIAQKEESKSIV